MYSVKLASFLRHLVSPLAVYLLSPDVKLAVITAATSGVAYLYGLAEKKVREHL